ncbi:ATP-dependent helicase [Candidatus Phytoplasma melaleucae]|uniref:DNA 3'-5' helicase n=1 Tax=Candidatus Phytoplasma melaleucae TaxID=2982630 RepID=A0ABT9DCU7_9MOLU|nr:ATP-dependent helicase ['Melaleuca sp.' phytoplasma]MDO8167937.1 ATP-dependent helicase ['Melaleuca sp.' phytoplasma]
MSTSLLLKELNTAQLKAVTNLQNALYVLAGAGTGKTKTLTTKIAYLITEKNIPSKNILAVTFTNDAAIEMKNRLYKFLSYSLLKDLTLGTFHVLGNQILKQNINKLNLQLNNHFMIADEYESKNIIQEILKKMNINKNLYSLSFLKKNISYLKNQRIKTKISNKYYPPSNLTNKKIDIQIEKIAELYQFYLQQNNLCDFDDLLIYTYQLLTNDSIAAIYQKKFDYLLVDEFQDIDLIQYYIIKTIAQKKNIFVVGDPNQSIYKFRGSDIICSQLLQQDFNASLNYLTQNYRSSALILAKANSLIRHNYSDDNQNFYKALKAVNTWNGEMIYQQFKDAETEANFVTQQIISLVNNNKSDYNEIAVLYRFNYLENEIENHLIMKQIPYNIQNNFSFYQKKEIRDFIAYLKIILFPQQDLVLKRILNVPKRGIGNKSIKKLEHIATMKNISLWEAINYLPKKTKKEYNLKTKLDNFKNIFTIINNKIHNNIINLTNIVNYIDNIIGYSQKISLNKTQKLDNNQNCINEQQTENIIRLQNILNKSETILKGTFFEKLRLVIDNIVLSNENNNFHLHKKVTLSSIHKAKGLEFVTVFLVGFEDLQNYQEHNYILDNYSLEEERRLAYVAITRAKQNLYISSVQKRFLFGKELLLKPSIFIKEMNLFPHCQKNYLDNKTQKKFYLPKKTFKTGHKIMHKHFGKGIIIAISNPIATVLFQKPHGLKKILITYLSSLNK